MKTYEWDDLSEDYADSLLLGNGSSIAFDRRFSYPSLSEEARDRGLITASLSSIFDHLDTADFEFVLRVIWHAQTVNEALQIKDSATEQAYEDIREALIQTVRSIHPEYSAISSHLESAASFMGQFQTVVSLNYDLLAYWSALKGNTDSPNRFKDCFLNGEFQYDWRRFREPYGKSGAATLLFFPHGNLVIGSDIAGVEEKLQASEYSTLLSSIIGSWKTGRSSPVFVSEGTSKQKLRAIRRSGYLSTIYEEVLHDLGESLVVLGWSFSDPDDHLIEAICRGNTRRFAVSARPASPTLEEGCARIETKLRSRLGINRYELVFFDPDSRDCWI